MFSQNSHADIYKDMPKNVIVSDTYYPELLAEEHAINHATKNKFNFLNVFDDYVDHKVKNDPEITRSLSIYRNSAQSIIQSFQGRTMMSAIGRAQCNYVIIGAQQTPLDWFNVLKEFLSMHLPLDMTLKEQIDFCKKATANHQFFCIDNIKGECYLTKLTKSQIS